ncbi:MAG: hypothetical protein QXR56_06350 [Thermofilaceae archaeon]
MAEKRKTPSLSGRGIVLGRPTLTKSSYEYVIVPEERTDIDVLVTVLPQELMEDRYVVNTRLVAEFFKRLYVVEYAWYRKPVTNDPTTGGVGYIDRGIITKVVQAVEISIDNPLEGFSKIDPSATYVEFHETPVVGPEFLRYALISVGGVSVTATPKRVLSAPVITRVKEDKVPLVLNLAETYLFLRQSPDLLKGIIKLGRFNLVALIVDEITRENVTEIVYGITSSLSEFGKEYSGIYKPEV